MKTVLYAAVALSIAGVVGPAMASDRSNLDTYKSLYQSHDMMMDGRNAKAMNEGQRSIVDFDNYRNSKYGYSAVIDTHDLEGTNR